MPNAFCSLLADNTPSISEVEQGCVLIPNQEVRNIEGSLGYTLKTMDVIHRSLMFDSQLVESKIQAIEEVKVMMQDSDVPPEFVEKIDLLLKRSVAQSQNVVEVEDALASCIQHVAYAQSTLELTRRTKMLKKLKFRAQVTPEHKRLLRSSPLCTNNIIDPDLSSQVLFEMRSSFQTRYPGHKTNSSTAEQESAVTKLATQLSLPPEDMVSHSPPVHTEDTPTVISVAEVTIGAGNTSMDIGEGPI